MKNVLAYIVTYRSGVFDFRNAALNYFVKFVCSSFFCFDRLDVCKCSTVGYGGNQQLGADIKTPKMVIDDFMDRRFGMFIHFGPVSLRGTEIGWSLGKEVPIVEIYIKNCLLIKTRILEY